MYILHTKETHGHYLDSAGTRWDIHVATYPANPASWDVFDSVEEAAKVYGLTEIPDVPLYDAKEETMNLIQKWIDLSVVAKKQIPCPVLGEDIVFDRQALINAMAIRPGMYWIGVSNIPHELDEEKIAGIQAALMTYVQEGIYGVATLWRGRVSEAETVEAVKVIADEVLAAWPKGEPAPEIHIEVPVVEEGKEEE